MLPEENNVHLSELTLLTARQVAEKFNISARQLVSLTQQRQIKAVRIGKRGLRYPVEALREFVARGGISQDKIV
jgi:excisionase family DNA binding protein